MILHACNLDGRLAMWGELTDVNTTKRHKLSSKRTKAPPHPFAAQDEDLFDTVTGLLFYGEDIGYPDCDATVWLPTVDGHPISSKRTIAGYPPIRTKTSIAPWNVITYRFDSEDAIMVLDKIIQCDRSVDGVTLGDSLVYWSDVMSLARSIITQQQFLPDVSRKNGAYRAVWEPVFTGKHAEKLNDLTKRMPAICRAITWPDAKHPPITEPVDAVIPLVTELVDEIVRRNINQGMFSITPYQTFNSAYDEWLHTLSDYDNRMYGDIDDLARLSIHASKWKHPLTILSESSFRLCFRLVAPEAVKGRRGASRWNVQCLVNPHNDPSLLIPAEDLWNGKVKIPNSGTYGNKESLLILLGHASELSTIVANGLRTGSMSEFTINTTAAYKFLTKDAAALERVGYGILLPSWWVGSRSEISATMQADIKSPTMRGNSILTMDTIVQFDWNLSLGNQKITHAELERLAKMKAPLVRMRGRWINANSIAIRSAIDLFRKAPKKATMRDAIRMKLRKEVNAQDMSHIKFTSSNDLVAEMLGRLDKKDKLEDLKQPRGFSGTLRPYQIRGYSWLAFLQKWGLGGCLADDMGLGKTIQMLALIQRYIELGNDRPVLLVCPMSVIENWRKETARFTPEISMMIHHGMNRKTDAAFKQMAKKHTLVISSYGTVQRDLSFIRKVRWGGVVLDEAQNIKNHDTKQARAVRVLDAEFRFAMTGTPVENNVGDLWSIMDFLNSGFLGTQAEFKKDFFGPIQRKRDVKATERLKHITGPFVLRRLKTDKSIITDLPDKVEIKVYCQLTKEQASLYSSVLQELNEPLESAEGIQRKGIILAVISKLKQICNHPAQFLKDDSETSNRSGKMARLTEMLAEAIDAGDRILIFTQFAEMGHIIQKHVQDAFKTDVPFLHGGTSRTHRARMVENFQDANLDGPRVFVLSLKAGGTGLNLTAANRVIHFDRWWNPAVEDQATDRAFRIGQTQNVQVHKFICVGTLEEKIDEMIERKKQVSEDVIGAGEKWITELSNDDLREVLSLAKGAVVM